MFSGRTALYIARNEQTDAGKGKRQLELHFCLDGILWSGLDWEYSDWTELPVTSTAKLQLQIDTKVWVWQSFNLLQALEGLLRGQNWNFFSLVRQKWLSLRVTKLGLLCGTCSAWSGLFLNLLRFSCWWKTSNLACFGFCWTKFVTREIWLIL